MKLYLFVFCFYPVTSCIENEFDHNEIVLKLIQPLSLFCSLFQSSMNLPPDKLKLLSQYDNEKKWELVCDQVRQFFFLGTQSWFLK